MFRRSAVVALSLAVASGVVLTGVPASASVSQGYIMGSGKVTDDWGDEGPLSSRHHKISGATRLWQWVLFAEGATEQDGTQFDASDVDNSFGPNTTYATKNLQKRWGLTADGIVGKNTFSRADDKLFYGHDDAYIGYPGKRVTLTFLHSNNRYLTESANGEYWLDTHY